MTNVDIQIFQIFVILFLLLASLLLTNLLIAMMTDQYNYIKREGKEMQRFTVNSSFIIHAHSAPRMEILCGSHSGEIHKYASGSSTLQPLRPPLGIALPRVQQSAVTLRTVGCRRLNDTLRPLPSVTEQKGRSCSAIQLKEKVRPRTAPSSETSSGICFYRSSHSTQKGVTVISNSQPTRLSQ